MSDSVDIHRLVRQLRERAENGLATCQSGNGNPKIVIEFRDLRHCQECYETLVHLWGGEYSVPGSPPEISPLANAASAAAAKIVHHPRWPRMAADGHALATKIIVTEMETMVREAWKEPSALRTHVLRYGPPGYDIYDAAEIARVLGEAPREENGKADR